MKKWLSLMLGLLLVLTLCACTGGNKPDPEPAPEPAAPPVPVPGSGPEPQKPEKIWSYAVRTQTYAGEYDAEDGTKLASVSYEYPILVPVDEDGAGDSGGDDTPPQAMLDVCAAFNARTDTPEDYAAMYERLKEIADSNWEAHLENDTFFSPCSDELRIAGIYQTDAFVSVGSDAWVYWGGAHPDSGKETLNFDLEKGEFIDWTDLTNEPDEMRALLGKKIYDAIFMSDKAEAVFPDADEKIFALEGADCCFNDEGIRITFAEYVIGPHILGAPDFDIPYAEFSHLLSERARRLLEIPQETLLLGDFMEAQRLWSFFDMGTMPFDAEHPVTMPDGDYYPVTYRGITTKAELCSLLEKRFSPELVDQLVSPDTGSFDHYREIDGVLCAMPADRGSDESRGKAEYRVERSGNSGRIIAAVEVLDTDAEMILNEETGRYEYPLKGYTTIDFPFTVTENGARFDAFESIW